MSTELAKMDQWQDMKGFGVNIPTTGTPRIHVCQDKSPEVKKTKIAAVGDLVVRPTGVNLGKSFDGVILSTDRRYFRWASEKNGDPEKDWNKVYWQAPAGALTPEQNKETLWREKDGKRLPPLASDTIRFIVLPVEGTGENMKLDPKGTGAVVVTMDRTSLKAGDTLASTLKGLNGPSFAAVVRFTTFSDATKKDVQVWAPTIAGYTSRKTHGATLVEAAKTAAALWDAMGRDEGGGGGETVSGGTVVDGDLPF